MDILYKMDPIKIMNLRIDSLSQILNMVNVQSGGRYMVYETGAQGLVVAAMLERIGGNRGTHRKGCIGPNLAWPLLSLSSIAIYSVNNFIILSFIIFDQFFDLLIHSFI